MTLQAKLLAIAAYHEITAVPHPRGGIILGGLPDRICTVQELRDALGY